MAKRRIILTAENVRVVSNNVHGFNVMYPVAKKSVCSTWFPTRRQAEDARLRVIANQRHP